MTKIAFDLSFMGRVTLTVPEREAQVYVDSIEVLGHGPVEVDGAQV